MALWGSRQEVSRWEGVTFKDSGPLTLVDDAVTRGTASDGVHLYRSDALGRVGRIGAAGGEITWLADLPRARRIALDDQCLYVAVGSTAQDTHDGAVYMLRK